MKYLLALLTVVMIVSAVALPALAETADVSEPDRSLITTEPAERLNFFGRLFNGAKNIVTAPLDIPFTIVRHTQESGNPIVSVVSGTLEGVVNGGVRLVAGAVEVVTSPVPGDRYPLYDRRPGERCIRERPQF